MTQTLYIHQIAIIVPADKLAPATALAAQHGRVNDWDTFHDFFSVPLSPTGAEPATHYGCHTAMRAKLHDRLPQLRTALGGGEWGPDFDTLAASMGLQRIEVIV